MKWLILLAILASCGPATYFEPTSPTLTQHESNIDWVAPMALFCEKNDAIGHWFDRSGSLTMSVYPDCTVAITCDLGTHWGRVFQVFQGDDVVLAFDEPVGCFGSDILYCTDFLACVFETDRFYRVTFDAS